MPSAAGRLWEGMVESDRTTSTRRKFLGTAAGATGVALASTVWSDKAAAASIPDLGSNRLEATKRGFATGHFALELKQTPAANIAGWVFSAEGGNAVTDVVNEKVGGDHVAKKHIGNVKYEDIAVQFGFGFEKTFFDWISATFDLQPVRRDGAIHAADFTFQDRRQRTFTQALITEIGFPACDGSAKDPAYMTLRFSPERTQDLPDTGFQDPPTPSRQKAWLPSNFRLEIDGLDCSKVNKIEAITLKQKVTENAVGQDRFNGEPTNLECSNLVVTLPASAAQTFIDWHKDFVIRGNSSDDKEKGGSLTFLAPDGKTELGKLTLSHVGIFALRDVPPPDPDDGDGNNNDNNGSAARRAARQVRAEMYLERIVARFGAEPHL